MEIRYEPVHRQLYEIALLAREEYGDAWLEPVRRWSARNARRAAAGADPAAAERFAARVRDEWLGRPEFDGLKHGLRQLRREGLEERVTETIEMLAGCWPGKGPLGARTFAFCAADAVISSIRRPEAEDQTAAQAAPRRGEAGVSGCLRAGVNLAVWPVEGWAERLTVRMEELIRKAGQAWEARE